MSSAMELYSKDVYEGSDPGDINSWKLWKYQPIVDSFGEILFQVDTGDYSGDTFVLYRFNGCAYGFLQFGWGSCSGCDALRACETIAEVDALIDEMEQSIRRWPNAEAALNWFRNHDWKGDYSWHEEEQGKFLKGALEILWGLVDTK